MYFASPGQGGGLAAFLFSASLTRSAALLASDGDDPMASAMIGTFGHCSQELVNLLLTGRARSHCFDGVRMLEELQLKGCDPGHYAVGFLTLFEFHNCFEVGQSLKSPLGRGIWVLNAESHYSLIFARSEISAPSLPAPHAATSPPFTPLPSIEGLPSLDSVSGIPLQDCLQLEYYDPLGRQAEPIKISLRLCRLGEGKQPRGIIEETLATKWSFSEADWMGSDRILWDCPLPWLR